MEYKPESNCIKERRAGVFTIEGDELRAMTSEELSLFFSHFVIYEVKYFFWQDRFRYKAFSPLFDQMERVDYENDEPEPWYDICMITEDNHVCATPQFDD